MTDPVVEVLRRAQRDLLDLSTRNRLLSLPRRSAGVVPIVGERSAAVFARSMREHPIRRMVDAGVRCTISTDDPCTSCRCGSIRCMSPTIPKNGLCGEREMPRSPGSCPETISTPAPLAIP